MVTRRLRWSDVESLPNLLEAYIIQQRRPPRSRKPATRIHLGYSSLATQSQCTLAASCNPKMKSFTLNKVILCMVFVPFDVLTHGKMLEQGENEAWLEGGGESSLCQMPGWTIWPYWRRTWPPTGNDLRQRSPRPKFVSKVVEFEAIPFEKIFWKVLRWDFWSEEHFRRSFPVGGHVRLGQIVHS